MFLRKESNQIYYLYYTSLNGKRNKVSTHTKLKSEAILFVRSFREKQKQSSLTVKSLSELCSIVCGSLERTHTKKTIKSLKNAFNQLIRVIGDMNPSLVSNQHIDRFVRVKGEEASQWTGLKYLRAVSSIYNHAIRMGYQLTNPCRNVLSPKLPRLIPVYMTEEDTKKLLNSITNIPFRRVCIFALSTGMRLGEIVQLRWEHLNLNANTVTVQSTETFTTKNKRNRTLPLSDTAIAVINEIIASKFVKQFVFLTPRGYQWTDVSLGHTFKRCVIKAGINPKYHFHTMRHTFASWLVQKGVNLYEVKELLGHSNITTTQIYAHLEPEKLHSTVNKISIPLKIT